MVRETLTKEVIAEAVARETGLSERESFSLVNDVLQHVTDGIVHDGRTLISGFGKFTVRSREEWISRHPASGEPFVVTARRVVKFVPSWKAKERIIEGNRSRRAEGE